MSSRPSPSDGEPTLYERLGVTSDAPTDEIRAAYRRQARNLHPDLHDGSATKGTAMAALNEAWDVLSDPTDRALYDRAIGRHRRPRRGGEAPDRPSRNGGSPLTNSTATTGWSPTSGARRDAWVASIRGQVQRFGHQASASAALTLALRHHDRRRDEYQAVGEALVDQLTVDTERRIKAARAAGASPLDLALATTLVGLRETATTIADLDGAEMADRMWDILAHEITHELADALGGPLHSTRRVRRP